MMYPKPTPRKKPKEWDEVRAELIPRFKAAGITSCEAQLDGCVIFRFLGFAHSKTKQHIKTDEDLYTCILCCTICHTRIEKHPLMEDFVLEVIAQRRVQP